MVSLSLLLGATYNYWQYSIYVPFIWEKFKAKPAQTPLDTLSKFQTALEANNSNEYLRYITKESRPRYASLFSKEDMRQKYIQPFVGLQEQYTNQCENLLTCQQIAVYSYIYEVKEAYWEEVAGQRFVVPAGEQELEIVFVEVADGYWQINEF